MAVGIQVVGSSMSHQYGGTYRSRKEDELASCLSVLIFESCLYVGVSMVPERINHMQGIYHLYEGSAMKGISYTFPRNQCKSTEITDREIT